MESMAWLSMPLQLHSSREFECDDKTPAECDWYKQRWHFWYIADYVFALPTVAFFMSAIGLFIIGYFFSSLLGSYQRYRKQAVWRKPFAIIRFLSYRGFHVRLLGWNSAPLGVLLLGATGAVFFFCMVLAPQPYYWSDEKFGGSPPLATRSGWLALGCMPFVFATASKANWITLLTGVSHEKLQIFHRWIAYAFFVLALLHTFPFIVYHIKWHDMEEHFSSSLLFYWTGIVALVFQAWLTFASHSTIRNLGYEFFKVTHFLAVVVFMITFFWHCDYTLTSWDYFIATAAIYVPCYAYPWLRTIFEYGLTQKAQVNVEDNGFIRVVIPAKFTWKPGQHCFLRFTGFGIFQSISGHPFTICSSPSTEANGQSELVFYIRRQGGFTTRLYQHAQEHPGALVNVLVDGPYGGVDLQKYYEGDHLLVIAGGSGAGWCLPFIERFIKDQNIARDEEEGQKTMNEAKETRPVAARRRHSVPVSLRVVLAVRDSSSRAWFHQATTELLSQSSNTKTRPDVNLEIYLTGEAAEKAHIPIKPLKNATGSIQPVSNSSNEDIQTQPDSDPRASITGERKGRPQLPSIIREEAAKVADAGQSLGVFVCGPTTMQNDVRNAVAEENMAIMKGSKMRGVYLHCEHFSIA